MIAPNDGGQVFPHNQMFVKENGEPVSYGFTGMTLRDYFAASTMQGMLIEPGDILRDYNRARTLAEASYVIADAMLKARAK